MKRFIREVGEMGYVVIFIALFAVLITILGTISNQNREQEKFYKHIIK